MAIVLKSINTTIRMTKNVMAFLLFIYLIIIIYYFVIFFIEFPLYKKAMYIKVLYSEARLQQAKGPSK